MARERAPDPGPDATPREMARFRRRVKTRAAYKAMAEAARATRRKERADLIPPFTVSWSEPVCHGLRRHRETVGSTREEAMNAVVDRMIALRDLRKGPVMSVRGHDGRRTRCILLKDVAALRRERDLLTAAPTAEPFPPGPYTLWFQGDVRKHWAAMDFDNRSNANQWMAGEIDRENVVACVRDQKGRVVGDKRPGDLTISWFMPR